MHCGINMGKKETSVKPKPGFETSHAVCDDCINKFYPDLNLESEATPKTLKRGGEQQ